MCGPLFARVSCIELVSIEYTLPMRFENTHTTQFHVISLLHVLYYAYGYNALWHNMRPWAAWCARWLTHIDDVYPPTIGFPDENCFARDVVASPAFAYAYVVSRSAGVLCMCTYMRWTCVNVRVCYTKCCWFSALCVRVSLCRMDCRSFA